MSRYVIDPLTRLLVNVTKLEQPRAAQWARGLVVLAFAVAGAAALVAV